MAIDYLQRRGQQRDTGPVNLVTAFREDETMGYRLGIEFMSDTQSVIGLEWLRRSKKWSPNSL